MEKLYCTPGQVSLTQIKLQLIKTIIWTDKSAHSKFYFSMSYYQKGSWACVLLCDPCSKQGIGDILIHTHKKCVYAMKNFTLGHF